MGNVHGGVFIWSPTNVLIGGTTPGARNIIANNGGDGIGTFAAGQSMTIAGNFIGTDITGTVPMGNAGAGIKATVPNIIIGGTTPAAGNLVANNGFSDAFDHAGIIVTASPVTILSNSIYDNNKLGIFLSGSQANQGQAAPTLTAVTSTASTTQITGTLTGLANTQYTVQFFSNTAADFSGFAEGQTFLGSVDVLTDGSGTAALNAILPVVVGNGLHVDATATDPAGNTSQFSSPFPPVVPTPAPTPTPTPPLATGIVASSHSKKGLIAITISFNEALDGGSVGNSGLYRVLGAVKKHKKIVFSKTVRIQGIHFDGNTDVTIHLVKPYKGAVQVTVLAGIPASNGSSSRASFSAVVK
jgi:hypothetical protein